MAHVAVDENKSEWIFEDKPERETDGDKIWCDGGNYIELPIGTIEKIIGKKLTWEDEPIELK